MMKVLVTGGTGVVGPEVVRRLLRRGHGVRLLSRHASDDRKPFEGDVEAFDGDIGDAASIRGAAEGCDAVIHLAATVAERPPEVTFERVNVEGTRNIVAEAERARVQRFVYVSSLGADRGESGYHRSKKAGEEIARTFSREWIILRPGNVFGPGDEQISLLLKMVRTLPVVPLVGKGDDPFQPIWCEDCGEALAIAAERADLAGRELDLAGPELTSMNQVLDRFEAMTDRHPTRIPLPAWIESTGAKLAAKFGIETPVNADQITMVTEGNVIPEGRENALDVLGVKATPLDESLAKLGDSLPERLPSEGLGPMHRKIYRAAIRGARLDAEGLIALVRDELPELTPRKTVVVGAEPESPTRIAPGATLTMALPLRGHVQVRVEEVSPRAITLATLEGHPLAGAVRFLAEPAPGEDGAVRFEVQTWNRASTLADLLVMETLGGAIQTYTWTSLVETVIERSGGRAEKGVEVIRDDPDEREGKAFERWLEELIHRRVRRDDAPAPAMAAG
ncbi:DUF1990 family protein [Sorangium sp. So ce341]|uniref:DUF1990 family protein n=1 Tax=Sorangium sp. So ce341 TaxID=3133302 RepID=UPI003F62EC7B